MVVGLPFLDLTSLLRSVVEARAAVASRRGFRKPFVGDARAQALCPFPADGRMRTMNVSESTVLAKSSGDQEPPQYRRSFRRRDFVCRALAPLCVGSTLRCLTVQEEKLYVRCSVPPGVFSYGLSVASKQGTRVRIHARSHAGGLPIRQGRRRKSCTV